MTERKVEKAEAFWEVLRQRDIVELRRSTNRKFLLLALLLGAITLCALFIALMATIRPTPVIAFDKQGKSVLFTDTVSNGTSEVRVRYFLSRFIDKYEGVSPRIDENLAEAYNLMVPKLREILLLKEAHAEKVATWKGKNLETRYLPGKLSLKGDLAVGSKIAVIGTGRFTFQPVVYSGTPETFERHIYYKAQLVVMPVTAQTVDGLLVEYFQGKSFDNAASLRAYLLENNIPLVDDAEGVIQ